MLQYCNFIQNLPDVKKYSDILKAFEKIPGIEIFEYEASILASQSLRATLMEALDSMPACYVKYFYTILLKFYTRQFAGIEHDMSLLLSGEIPANVLEEDHDGRLFYFIADITKKAEHYRLAYDALTMGIGLLPTDRLLQTRKHAYICDAASHCGMAETYNGILVEPGSSISANKLAPASPAIKVIGILRMRNEASVILECLKTFSCFVDAIVIFDDCSDDGTYELVQEHMKQFKVAKLIRSEVWLFNEEYAHNILFSEARALGGTHFVQLDADEILSGAWLRAETSLREIMKAMLPGDCLAVPWLDMVSENSRLDRYRLIGKIPNMRGIMYKDIVYCDDGLTRFGNNMMHASIIPAVYRRRFIVTDQKFALLHLETCNFINVLVKKDWYRVFEYHNNNNKRVFAYTIYNVHSEAEHMPEATVSYNAELERYGDFNIEAYKEISLWRIAYIIEAIRQKRIPDDAVRKLHIDYAKLAESLSGNASFINYYPQLKTESTSKKQPGPTRKTRGLRWFARALIGLLGRNARFLASCGSQIFQDKFLEKTGAFSKFQTCELKDGPGAATNSETKTVLAVCLGFNQLYILEALCIKRYGDENIKIDLLIYRQGAPLAVLRDMAECAAKSGIFTNIHVLPEIMDTRNLRMLHKQYIYKFWAARLKRALGHDSYEELVLPKLFHPPEKFLADIFDTAGIVLFDEGARACIDMPTGKAVTPYKMMVESAVAPQHQKRIEAAYFTHLSLGIPNYIRTLRPFTLRRSGYSKFESAIVRYLDFKDLRNSLLRTVSVDAMPDLERPYVLLLSQGLNVSKLCTLDQEVAIYAEAINWLRKKLKHIIFKPHLDDSGSLADKLRSQFPDLHVYTGNLTAEQLILYKQPEAVVGLFSSVLFFCRDHNICDAYTLVSTSLFPSDIQIDRDHVKIIDITKKSIYPISFI